MQTNSNVEGIRTHVRLKPGEMVFVGYADNSKVETKLGFRRRTKLYTAKDKDGKVIHAVTAMVATRHIARKSRSDAGLARGPYKKTA